MIASSCVKFAFHCLSYKAHATCKYVLPCLDLNEQVLLNFVPGLRSRLQQLSPELQIQLAQDPASIADKLVALKLLFPTANVQRIVQQRCV